MGTPVSHETPLELCRCSPQEVPRCYVHDLVEEKRTRLGFLPDNPECGEKNKENYKVFAVWTILVALLTFYPGKRSSTYQLDHLTEHIMFTLL